MPEPITWNTISKAIGDLTTIVEQIQSDIETHNQEAASHKDAGASLDGHRTAVPIDHPEQSVDTAQIKDDSVTTDKMSGYIEFTDADATFDTATCDNGAGGQPAKVNAKYKTMGDICQVYFDYTGVKAGTNRLIKTTAFDIPTPNDASLGQCIGYGSYYDGTNYYQLHVIYQSAGVIWLFADANITDNVTMTDLSAVLNYRITP